MNERAFSDILFGSWQDSTGKIEGTDASYLALPTLSEQQYHLIATSGPGRERSVVKFWEELVLDFEATMIVCLCNDISSVGGFGWGPEASQYWPTDDEPVMTFTYDSTITVTLLES